MMDMHDRIMRVLDTTHVVRIEDSTVYKVLDIVPLGDDVLFVETIRSFISRLRCIYIRRGC